MNLDQVKNDAGRVDLEVINVASTPEETLLLQSLEKLVLRRVMKVAPNSDPALQARTLLRRTVSSTGVTTRGRDGDREMVRSSRESSPEFPSQAYAVLCQQALTIHARNGVGTVRTVGEKGEGGDNDEVLDEYHITELMDLTFAMDETGNEVAWRKLLRLLEERWESPEEEMEEGEVCYDSGNAGGKEPGMAETDDLDRDDAVHIIRSYLLPSDAGSDEDNEAFDKTSEAEAGAGGSGSGGVPGGEAGVVLGSKLERIAKLLVDHRNWCDRSGYDFSAIVFVSTRELAMTTPDTLASIPALKPFLRPRYVLGTLEGAMASDEGQANVIVSTPMYGVGLKVPDRGLVVCASGSSVTDLRGRLLYGENCRSGLQRGEENRHVWVSEADSFAFPGMVAILPSAIMILVTTRHVRSRLWLRRLLLEIFFHVVTSPFKEVPYKSTLLAPSFLLAHSYIKM